MSTPTAPADEPVAVPPDEKPPSTLQRIGAGSSTQIGLILVALIAAFSLLSFDEFFAVANARNIATDAAVLLVLAVGATYVIVTAGIDLSVGSVLVFSGVVSAKLMNSVGGNNWGVILLGFAASLAAGLAWGLFNGVLVAKAKLPAFIVTLGSLGMSLGAAYLITGGVDEREVPFRLVSNVGIGRVLGIPYLV
ncbi:MAG: ABC transporter permease, partial [Actinomycetota bacterium]|nr:ABC transporter permease [Actinomycetota bacterium]